MIGSSRWVAERVARREVRSGWPARWTGPTASSPSRSSTTRSIGIAAPGQAELRDGRVSVDDMAAQTLLVREPGSSTRAVAERILARVGYRPAKRWELDSNEAIKRSVRAGLGIGFVSRLVVAEELERGELEAFKVEGAGPMRRSVYLLRPDGRDPVPAERAFIQTLCSCCAASVAGCTVEPHCRPSDRIPPAATDASRDLLLEHERPAPTVAAMYFRQLLNDETACASYLLRLQDAQPVRRRCDPHVDLVDEYIALADAQGIPIVAVFETHVQADHVSGLPELVARTGATAYLPEGAGVAFEHRPLADGEVVDARQHRGAALATPGHARRTTPTW